MLKAHKSELTEIDKLIEEAAKSSLMQLELAIVNSVQGYNIAAKESGVNKELALMSGCDRDDVEYLIRGFDNSYWFPSVEYC